MLFHQVKNYFDFDLRGATWKKEIIGGVSTFFAMCYILFVNPSFMYGTPVSSLISVNGETVGQLFGVNSIGGLFLGCALVSFLATFFMGLVSRVPLCQAPGMGLNTFFVYQVAMQFGFGYQQALVIVMCAGILYFLVAVTPIRQIMFRSFSKNLKIAIGTMTGLFIAYIGFANTGIIGPGVWGAPSGISNAFNEPIVIIGIVGVFILMGLHFFKVPNPIIFFVIIGLVMLAICYGTNPTEYARIFSLNSYNDFAYFGNISSSIYTGQIWAETFKQPLAYVAILTFFFMAFMDASGCMYSVISGIKVPNSNINFENIDNESKGWKNPITRANVVEGLSSAIAPFFLQSPVVTFIESKTGVSMGSKTGISSMITGVLFLVAIALWPILNPLLPIALSNGNSVQPISGPILIFVGVLSIGHLRDFTYKGNPANVAMLLFTLIMGILGYSISNGIAWGVIVYLFVSTCYSIQRVISEDVIKAKKQAANGFIEGGESKGEQVVVKRNFKYWKDKFLSKTNGEINLVILITALFSTLYVIVDALVIAGVITAAV